MYILSPFKFCLCFFSFNLFLIFLTFANCNQNFPQIISHFPFVLLVNFVQNDKINYKHEQELQLFDIKLMKNCHRLMKTNCICHIFRKFCYTELSWKNGRRKSATTPDVSHPYEGKLNSKHCNFFTMA